MGLAGPGVPPAVSAGAGPAPPGSLTAEPAADDPDGGVRGVRAADDRSGGARRGLRVGALGGVQDRGGVACPPVRGVRRGGGDGSPGPPGVRSTGALAAGVTGGDEVTGSRGVLTSSGPRGRGTASCAPMGLATSARGRARRAARLADVRPDFARLGVGGEGEEEEASRREILRRGGGLVRGRDVLHLVPLVRRPRRRTDRRGPRSDDPRLRGTPSDRGAAMTGGRTRSRAGARPEPPSPPPWAWIRTGRSSLRRGRRSGARWGRRPPEGPGLRRSPRAARDGRQGDCAVSLSPPWCDETGTKGSMSPGHPCGRARGKCRDREMLMARCTVTIATPLASCQPITIEILVACGQAPPRGAEASKDETDVKADRRCDEATRRPSVSRLVRRNFGRAAVQRGERG